MDEYIHQWDYKLNLLDPRELEAVIRLSVSIGSVKNPNVAIFIDGSLLYMRE